MKYLSSIVAAERSARTAMRKDLEEELRRLRRQVSSLLEVVRELESRSGGAAEADEGDRPSRG